MGDNKATTSSVPAEFNYDQSLPDEVAGFSNLGRSFTTTRTNSSVVPTGDRLEIYIGIG